MKDKDIKQKLSELKELALKERLNIAEEIRQLESKLHGNNHNNNSAWSKVKLSRLIERPTTLDYINMIFDDFIELHGDRLYADDPAMVGGIGLLNGRPVTIIGQQRGRNLKENLKRNGGMALPEGYRKALRLVRQAEKFGRPVVSFVDTQGAYGGVEAEERGIAEAIARNLKEFFSVKVPIVVVLIGQGGSGGALGIGIGDTVFMLENSTYSVISPEGCASILLRDGSKAQFAASIMKPTARDLFFFKIIDEIIEEPAGGAHTNPEVAAANIKNAVWRELVRLMPLPRDQLLKERFEKFRKMGVFFEKPDSKKGLLRRLFGRKDNG